MEYSAPVCRIIHQPILLEWKEVAYAVKVPPQDEGILDKITACGSTKRYERKQILSDCTGYVAPGQTLAIIGPSGSGKTTLLNVLARVIPNSKWNGTVKINGEHLTRHAFKQIAAYLPQFDILFGSQTVYEACYFSAKLKQSNLTELELEKLILDMLDELGLTKVKDTIVGYVGEDASFSGLTKGISGGERKRLSLGLGLMGSPSVLFLDEPTTGLDSFAAESVVRTLYQQSRLGRTVLFTIHQPSSDIMGMFDSLLIMANGRQVYFGPCKNAFKFFASLKSPVPVDENPCEFFLDALHYDPAKKKNLIEPPSFDAIKERSTVLANSFKESQWYSQTSAPAALYTNETTVLNTDVNPATPWHIGFYQLLKRSNANVIRDPVALQSMVMMNVIVSVVFGIVYLDLGKNQASIGDRTGALFLGIVCPMFLTMMGPFHSFAVERKIFLFQHREGLYGAGTYYVSKLVAEVPGWILRILLYAVITYFMWNLDRTFYKFFIYALNIFLVTALGWSFSSMIVGCFPNPAVGLNLFPLLVIPLMLFSGFYVNSQNVRVYFIWVEYISFVKYSFRCVMANEFRGLHFYCDPTESAASGGVCQFETGEEYLHFRLLDDMPTWGDIGVLCGMIIGFNFFAFLLTKRLAANSKK